MNIRKNTTNLSIKKNKTYNSTLLSELFIKTSTERGIKEILVEKDFWVVTILDWIFNKSPYKDYFVFKGGTSLSKVHSLINRFSEDIDLSIDYFKIDPEFSVPDNQSTTALNKTKEKQVMKIKLFFENEFSKAIKKYLSVLTDLTWKVDIVEYHTNIQISLWYDSLFSASSAIKNRILIECSCFSDSTLKSNYKIVSFVAQSHPFLFTELNIPVIALDWIRTFWEKITILHSKSFAQDINEEYSRHYYDVYCIANNNNCKDKIMDSINELFKVASYKDKYYHSAQSQYNIIKEGKLSLIPRSKIVLEKLTKFYHNHKVLYYASEQLSFKEILKFLKELENKINKKISQI